MTEEQQAIEGLLTHPGWLLFRAYCRGRWGAEGYGRQLKLAVSTAIQKSESPDAALKAVDFANDEINALLTWPDQHLKALNETVAREQAEPTISRRGPNL
jgi:hypothetical protein